MKTVVCICSCCAVLALWGPSAVQAQRPDSWGRYGVQRANSQVPAGREGRIRQSTAIQRVAQTEPAPDPLANEDNPFTDDAPWQSSDGAPGPVETFGEGYSGEGYSGDCGGDCGGCGHGRGGLWYGSVDYLLFRPRMSQAVAEVRRVDTIDQTTNPVTSTSTDTSEEFPFKYQSAFRVAAGYRLLDCGGDFEVAYWRLTNDASYSDGPADITNNNPAIAGNLKNNPGNGQFLQASTGITANIFDVTFAKCIAMGGPCNPCDCCFCPRWDLRFFAGARIGDISRFNDNVVTEANGNGVSWGNIDARFVGAGPRVGVQGRRYFGECGQLSIFAKGAQSLLIGEYDMSRTLTAPGSGSVTPTQITRQFDNFDRMIPVTDIELGGTWQIAPYTFVSIGWFFQCWWDLGQGETIPGSHFGALDTSNILGFDGLFVRGEMLF